jgi:Skp family chaperone for outer membrane proteins
MKLTKFFSVLCIALFAVNSAEAQNTKSEKVEYTYIQLPLNPLAKTITNYQSLIFAAYEAENQKKRGEYEAQMAAAEMEFQKEQAAYPAKVKAAEDKYAAEMAEWEKKSLAEKVVEKQLLNENNKPVKQLPSPPYKRGVSQPKLKTSYDYPVLAASNLKLDGYNNSPSGAVKIEVTLYGFEYTPPRQLTEQKSIVSSANGTTSTSQVTYYHVEFTYRHTMSVKVTSPEGVEMFVLSPSELNNYKTYKSADSKTSVSFNEEQLVKTYEEKILQENLKLINELVNDRIGFRRTERTTELNYVKSKDETYADLMNAFNEASTGLKMLLDDKASATAKLEKSIQLWETALTESDVANKKARIDKDVTIITCFNLLEVYFATGKVESGEKIIQTMNALSLSASERKTKEAYELAFTDMKKRIEANK